jgi:mRNA interferase RelE/StbE
VYQIKISRDAERFLRRTMGDDRQKIEKRISSLAENPRCEGVEKLVDTKIPKYRIRQGNYRIIFSIHDDILIIEIIDIRHRQGAYKQ